MRVHLTASFRKDLDAIWDFLARSSVEAADRVTAELIDRALEIASMPEGAAFVPQLRHLETRRVLVRRWAILYGVMG
jgi:plasmid stabilization system protein ParE